MEAALAASQMRPKRKSLTAMRQRLHAVRVGPKLRASLMAVRQRLHAVRVRPIRASLTAMRQGLHAVRVRSKPRVSLTHDGDACASGCMRCDVVSFVDRVGQLSCTPDSRRRWGSSLENSRLSSRTRGGRSSFPVMGVDIVEGVFEHNRERLLRLAARHLDRDRGAAMLESTAIQRGAGRTGDGQHRLGTLAKKRTEEQNTDGTLM